MLARCFLRKSLGLALVAWFVAGLAPPSIAANAPARAEIPVKRVLMPNGIARYTVDITVNGIGPIPALLDTGSTGLIVMAGVIEAKRFAKTGTFYDTFSSGEKMSGIMTQGRIGLGGLDTGVPIRFGSIQTVTCIAARPKCSAALLKPKDYAIAGDGIAGAGFKAILGIGLDHFFLPNPLVGAGANTWIVRLPQAGKSDGAIIVNPTVADLDGFKRYPVSRESFHQLGAFRASVPGCLASPATGLNLCGQVALDTGTPGVFAQVPDLPAAASVHAPQRYSLNLFEGAGRLEIPIEETWNTRRIVYFERTTKTTTAAINAGAAPYLSYLVFYDYRNNQVGLKPR